MKDILGKRVGLTSSKGVKPISHKVGEKAVITSRGKEEKKETLEKNTKKEVLRMHRLGTNAHESRASEGKRNKFTA